MPSTDDQESGGESVSGTSARRQKRGVLPKQATSVMRAWLFQHLVVREINYIYHNFFIKCSKII